MNTSNESEKIIDITNKGRNILVYRMPDQTYSGYVNGRETQWDRSAEDIIRWLGNALEDGSELCLTVSV
ncbi:MAG: hypothetical protein EOP83_20890 [Verrucomicrobiaceae bacterium]|nr:MAG: hypothetical protein EOP83_20890 [Verrucomicrobiaceae bacterium]